jgi:hypothetical protein
MSPDYLPLSPPAAAPALGLAPIIDISANDASDDFIFGSGWGQREGHLRWAIGHHSDLIIRPGFWRADAAYGRIFALIEATPFLGLDLHSPQRIGISLNGHFLRDFALSRGGLIGFWIPQTFIGRPLMISLSHLSARMPASYRLSDDTRLLAFAFHRLQIWNIPHAASAAQTAPPASIAPADCLAHFESLGDNCEFGLAQRSTGIEPLGLFRFTATPFASLIDGLLHEFAGLGEPETIHVEVRGDVREYILTEDRWNLTYHTFVLADDMPAGRVIHREAQKLTLLKRRMLDDLRAARRIYLIKHNDGLAEEDVVALFLLLNRFAPNRLLYAAPAHGGHPAGTIRQITPGLLCGHIERFAPYDAAADFSIDAWLDICAKALDAFETACAPAVQPVAALA